MPPQNIASAMTFINSKVSKPASESAKRRMKPNEINNTVIAFLIKFIISFFYLYTGGKPPPAD